MNELPHEMQDRGQIYTLGHISMNINHTDSKPKPLGLYKLLHQRAEVSWSMSLKVKGHIGIFDHIAT